MKKSNFLIYLCFVMCFMAISTACTKTTDSIGISNNSQISKEDYSELRLVSPSNEIKKISKENVMEIKQGMTYLEIIKTLGATKDVGSGLFVA